MKIVILDGHVVNPGDLSWEFLNRFGQVTVYERSVGENVAVRIGDAHEDLREQIAKAFADAFCSDDYYDRITTRPRQSSEGNMALAIKNVAFSAANKWSK